MPRKSILSKKSISRGNKSMKEENIILMYYQQL